MKINQTQINKEINHLIDIALLEDLGADDLDVTSEAAIATNSKSTAIFNAREDLVFVGTEILTQVFKRKNIKVKFFSKDGAKIHKGKKIAEVSGNTKNILLLERTALNFVQYLSAIATQTAKFVAEVSHAKAKILDTRKTLPAYRHLAKYAVKCGGGVNHRIGLYDAILIKDNHIAAVGGVEKAIENSRKKFPKLKIEIEVDNLKQFQEILNMPAKAQPNIILLDNFTVAQLKKAVSLNKKSGGKIKLEASGGVNIKTVKKIAESGVDYISIGALTHSVKAIDIGLDFI